MRPSISEDNGIAALLDEDVCIYSAGISTGGRAEMRMAAAVPMRKVIATTIDRQGAEFAQKQIAERGLEGQIEVLIEDVAKPLQYADGYFDFIYARLILHYLPKSELKAALGELYRVLKLGGRMFVVVRSVDCADARDPASQFDADTGMTACMNGSSRYFHSEESIRRYLEAAGFRIDKMIAYDEQLYVDFQRTQPLEKLDALIEVLAIKV